MDRWYAIIHSANSKIPRSFITSDDGPINLSAHVGPGEWGFQVEELLREDDGSVSLQKMREMVASYHGIDSATIPPDLCGIVDPDSLIVNVVHADPEIDTHPDGDVVSVPPGTAVDDKHVDGEVLKRFAVTEDGVVTGFIWDATLDPALMGMVVPAGELQIGESLPPLVDVPSTGTQTL